MRIFRGEGAPSPRKGDDLESETKRESMVKGIYADENSAAEICTDVAYFLSSRAAESKSHTSGVVEGCQ
jgi:hypothetical protein